MTRSETRSPVGTRRRLAVGLLVTASIGGLVLALTSRRAKPIEARCDVATLEARAPLIDQLPLVDEALTAHAGEAVANILEYCEALPTWYVHHLSLWSKGWSPRIPTAPTRSMGPPVPRQLQEYFRRNCDQYEQLRYVPEWGHRERGLAIFELCRLEDRGVLTLADAEYLDSPSLVQWTVHQLLLDSGLSEDAARRYFLLFVIAWEISERAPGDILLQGAQIALEDPRGSVRTIHLLDDGSLPEIGAKELRKQLDLDSGCPSGALSIAANEPIANLRWLLDTPRPEERCAHERLSLAIPTRRELLRPLRVQLGDDDDSPPEGRTVEVDIDLDEEGRWREREGPASGDDASDLLEWLDARQPTSLVLHAAPAARAEVVFELARAADSWRFRGARHMRLWLKADGK